MSTPDSAPDNSSDHCGVLAFRGPDAARFLQGQLSADMDKLSPGASTLAGLHNPQGRVIAMLCLVRTGPEEILARLPLELAPSVAARLRKYVFRAKVRIDELPGAATFEDPALASPDRALTEIRAGVPEVYAATSEAFVAQMLNLDLLGAIAFDKGCYTGQEVIARAHYRGRVKRRAQRWLNASGTPLRPGDSARASDGRTLAVVRVAATNSGQQELLAVGTFDLGAERSAEMLAAVSTGEGGETASVEVSGPLPLPYSFPE